MRKLLPLVMLLAGCSSVGPLERRPGGNVVLPKYISPGAGFLQALACVAQQRDSASKGSSPSPARDVALGGCASDAATAQSARPPR
jgi:hypothetical protein